MSEKIRWNAVQWITNSTNEHHFPYAKCLHDKQKIRKRGGEREGAREGRRQNKEMDQSFRSTSSYVECMQEYTMMQVCIVFRFIFNFRQEMMLQNWLSTAIAPFSLEHCRLFHHRNVHIPSLYYAQCRFLVDACCARGPVFGNSTITKQQQIINSHFVYLLNFPSFTSLFCKDFLLYFVLNKSAVWNSVGQKFICNFKIYTCTVLKELCKRQKRRTAPKKQWNWRTSERKYWRKWTKITK